MILEKKLEVLIVDDDAATLKILNKSLITSNNNLRITLLKSGLACIEKLKTSTFDLIILDYFLPDMDGLKILKWLKEAKISTPVVIITASENELILMDAVNHGVKGYIIKKEGYIDDLINYIKNVLSKKAYEEIDSTQIQIKILLADDDLENLSRIDGMRRLITDLLDITRIESGQHKRELVLLNLHNVASEIIEGLELQAKEKNIKITFECVAEVPLRADKFEIDIVLTNLLTNAIKYNNENGSVDFQIKKQNGNTIISCEDTGIGMTGEELALLFTEFKRIKNEKTRNIPGSGLGLSIVKNIGSV